jgi:hypothetical protein
MNKYKIIIKQIIITSELFTIISTNDINFVSKINKGSIDFKIFNEDCQEVNLSNIEEGETVYIYTIPIYKSIDLINETIIIKKIIIKNKYIFNSESSDNSNDSNDFMFI